MSVVRVLAFLLRALLLPTSVIAAENSVLRQQLAVLKVTAKRSPAMKRLAF